MLVNIKGTKIKLTNEIKSYIREKMDMLEKYLGKIQVINCDVEVGLDVGGQNRGDIYRAEVNLNLPGELLRVEKTEKDLYKAIDKVKDHLELVIKKYKDKKIGRKNKKLKLSKIL
jgi:putative sigma-54 modulation protein